MAQSLGPRRQPVSGERPRNSHCCADNATGNFTKIVQRVPVKIVLDDHSLSGLLRPGMSAEPTIDTKATVLAERDMKSRLASDTAPTRSNGG